MLSCSKAKTWAGPSDCIGLLRLYALLEKQFMTSDYEHWKNN